MGILVCSICILVSVFGESDLQTPDSQIESSPKMDFDVQIQSTGKILVIFSKAISKVSDPDLVLIGLMNSRPLSELMIANGPLRVKDVYYAVFLNKNRKSLDREDFPVFKTSDAPIVRDQLIAKLATRLVNDRHANWSIDELSRFHLSLNESLMRNGLVARYMGPLGATSENDSGNMYSWKVSLDRANGECVFRIRLLDSTSAAIDDENQVVLKTKKNRLIVVDQFNQDLGEFRKLFEDRGQKEIPNILEDIPESY